MQKKVEKRHIPNIPVVLDNGALMPRRAHPWDAGADLYTREAFMIEAHDSAVVDTGVHMAIPEGYVGLIKSKSGLNVKYGLTAEGVIDAHYTGSIVVKLYNNSDTAYEFSRGDKITQLLIMPCETPVFFEVEALGATDRGASGFGSTGK